MTSAQHDFEPAAQSSRRAPPIGRVLRLLVGVLLASQVAPAYFRVDIGLALRALALTCGLVIVYCVLQLVLARRLISLNGVLGALAGAGILVAVYLVGTTGTPLVGHGAGELAAATFFGVSLLVAGIRGDPGCEVLAIPGALMGTHAEVACLVFSPLDALERRWRGTRAA